jgi:hypothetical protein
MPLQLVGQSDVGHLGAHSGRTARVAAYIIFPALPRRGPNQRQMITQGNLLL